MTLKELNRKVFVLIEEAKKGEPHMTQDPDLEAKMPDVTNQVMFELARLKKIPKYVEMEVHKGDIVDFQAIEKKCGYEVYQIASVWGVCHEQRANGTVLRILEDGTLGVDVFVYPERITPSTKDSYEFELSPDVLEIMPYGIAGDLLKSDVSAKYGNIYATRYESMLQRLDPRYSTGTFTIEGGYYV